MSRTYFCSPDDLAELRSRFPSDATPPEPVPTNWRDIFGIKVYASPFLKDGEGVLMPTPAFEFAPPKFKPHVDRWSMMFPYRFAFTVARKAFTGFLYGITADDPHDPLSLAARIRIRKRRMKRERRLAIKAENARRGLRR